MGSEKFMGVDIRVRVKGGGHVSQIYGVCVCPRVYVCACVQPVVVIDASSHTAIRQAISKSLVAYYQKCKWIHLRWREKDYNLLPPLQMWTKPAKRRFETS